MSGHGVVSDSAESNESSSTASSSKRARLNSSFVEDWLRRDSHTPSIVLHYLQFHEMALLHSTSRAWRDYISHRPIHRLKRAAYIWPRQLKDASASSWFPQNLEDVSVFWMSDFVDQPVFLLQCSFLPAFSHITSLNLSLRFELLSTDTFRVIGQLASLRTLRINEAVNFAMMPDPNTLRGIIRQIRFTELQHCRQLTAFTMHGSFQFYCSRDQVQDLIHCQSLTSLDCGTWAGIHIPEWDFGRSNEQRLSEGLAVLSQLPLQQLEINCSHCSTKEDWQYLRQITTLTRLTPGSFSGWPQDIGEDWQSLSSLTSLNTFKFGFPSGSQWANPIPAPLVSALARTPSITELELDKVAITNVELASILHSLSHLVELRISGGLESLDPFAKAPDSLRSLQFDCLQFDKTPLLFHLHLPIMPNLTLLIIEDLWLFDVQWPGAEFRGDETAASVATAFQFMLKAKMPGIANEMIYVCLRSID